MTQVSNTTIPVYYMENGKQQRKELSFKGNFGFKLNDKSYTVKNGSVYNQNGQKLKSIGTNSAIAYQLIGMSNTAESYKDYTFSPKDIKQAYEDERANYTVGGTPVSDVRSRTIIGNSACTSIDGKTTCDGTTYTTECRDKNGHRNKVSVWLLK